MSAHQTPEEIRKSLTHPVVDGDGHWVEYDPVFAEQMRKVTGDLGANGFLQSQRRGPDSLTMTPAQRAERGVAMEGFWGRQSTNTLDRATAMMPKMLYERLDEIGSDFAIIYPTAGLRLPRIVDDETRRAVIRGFNIVTHDYFKDLADKLTPAAVIPVHTPEEAIEELTFVTKQLGAKVCMFGRRAPADPTRQGCPRRPHPLCPGLRSTRPSTATTITTRCGRNARIWSCLCGRLAQGIRAQDYTRWGEPGIRAQLLDVKARKLEMDFVIEGDEKSTHLLNAVSPGWTCSIPFATYAVDRIQKTIG